MINSELVRLLNPHQDKPEFTYSGVKPLTAADSAVALETTLRHTIGVDLASGTDFSVTADNLKISCNRHQPHQTRVITESQELATRLTALQAFIKSDRFSSVEIAEQSRLLRQELIMIELLAVLNERIAAW